MKKIFDFIKKTFYNTSALYLLLSVALMLVFFTQSDLDPASSGAVTLQLYSLMFSFLAAFVFSVFGAFPKLPGIVKYPLEFLLCYGAFYLSFFAVTGNSKNFTAFFASSTAFVVVYAIIGVAVLAARRVMRDKKSADEYESVYSEIQKDKE